jgi:sulfatase modifying factor 1
MKITLLALALTFGVLQVQAQSYPNLVKVTGGTFNMGDEHGKGMKDELPIHEITLSDFYISETEVTVDQYRTYCTSSNVSMPEEPSWGWNDNDPIVNVTWDDAIKYCDWYSEKFDEIITLPTEAQWEFAARGGNQSHGYVFSGDNGVRVISLALSVWYFKSGWYESTSDERTNSVATKEANELDLYDMSGNVWEWCLDYYGQDYYSKSTSENPVNASEDNGVRVIRGGAWNSYVEDCRVSNRESAASGGKADFLGFRVVSN